MDRKFLCHLGLHSWELNRPMSILDGFPPIGPTDYKLPTRKCRRCSKEQEWLPGYGGSEWGCWT